MHWYRSMVKVANLECGYTCHAKCQMKAPQDCTGVNLKLEAKKSKKKKKAKDGEEEDGDSVNGNGSLQRTNSTWFIENAKYKYHVFYSGITTPTSDASRIIWHLERMHQNI